MCYEGFQQGHLVNTDCKRLQQVLLNLTSNSVKFTERNGKIKINVKMVRSMNQQQDLIEISVVDSGMGIKKKDKNKIFTMFGSIKDEKKKINTNGIGLGLVISQMIVQRFGGNINFKSKYKVGTIFTFSFLLEPMQIISHEMVIKNDIQHLLPATIEDKQVAFLSGFEIYKNIFKNHKQRILIVDDEEFCIETMRHIFKLYGLDVENKVDFCINGIEAV